MEEQHAAALRVLKPHLSRASSAKLQSLSKPRNHAQQLTSKAIDADDAWLAQLDPAVRSLLVQKQPIHLTTNDRAELR